MDKRFIVSFHFDVKHVADDGSVSDFCNSSMEYHDMPYESVLMMENGLLNSLQQMMGMGITKAHEMGLSEKMKSLGLV